MCNHWCERDSDNDSLFEYCQALEQKVYCCGEKNRCHKEYYEREKAS